MSLKRKYNEMDNLEIINAANILMLIKLDDLFKEFIINDTFENIHENIIKTLNYYNLIVMCDNLSIIGIIIYRFEIKFIKFCISEIDKNKYHVKMLFINKLKLFNVVKKFKSIYCDNFMDKFDDVENTCELFAFIDENIKLLKQYNFDVDHQEIYSSYSKAKQTFITQNVSKSLFEFVLRGSSECKNFCEYSFTSYNMFSVLICEFDKNKNITYLNNLYIIAFFSNSVDKAKIVIEKIFQTIQTNIPEIKKILCFKILNDTLVKFNIKLNDNQQSILKDYNNIDNLFDSIYESFFPKLKSILLFNKV